MKPFLTGLFFLGLVAVGPRLPEVLYPREVFGGEKRKLAVFVALIALCHGIAELIGWIEPMF